MMILPPAPRLSLQRPPWYLSITGTISHILKRTAMFYALDQGRGATSSDGGMAVIPPEAEAAGKTTDGETEVV